MSCDPRKMCGDAGMRGLVRSHHNQVRTLAFSPVQDSFGRCSTFYDEIHREIPVGRNKLFEPFRRFVTHSLSVFRSTIAAHLDNMQHDQVGVLLLRQPVRVSKGLCRTRQQIGSAENFPWRQFRYWFWGNAGSDCEHRTEH
jgi:hypothetical protein